MSPARSNTTLIDDAGLAGWVSTQMCLDATVIRTWIEHERSADLHLPIRLGIPGVIDRTRLLTVGTRLGIGASLRFLSKHGATMTRLVAPGGYDPSELLVGLAPDSDRPGIEALHAFTFDSVGATLDRRRRFLDDAYRATA